MKFGFLNSYLIAGNSNWWSRVLNCMAPGGLGLTVQMSETVTVNNCLNKQWCLATISRLLKRIDTNETCDIKCGSRYPRSVQTSANTEQWKEWYAARMTCHIVIKASWNSCLQLMADTLLVTATVIVTLNSYNTVSHLQITYNIVFAEYSYYEVSYWVIYMLFIYHKRTRNTTTKDRTDRVHTTWTTHYIAT